VQSQPLSPKAQDAARRMLEYLFSPLVEVASKAMRER
jgi:hypothetical protein